MVKRVRRQHCKKCGTYLDDETFKKTHQTGYCKPCHLEWYRAWCKTRYPRGSVQQRAYYFGRNNTGSHLTAGSLNNILETQRKVCKTCGIDLANVKWEIDHILPVSVGGTHDPNNLQILCKRCNRAKDNGSMEDFLTWIKHIAERISHEKKER